MRIEIRGKDAQETVVRVTGDVDLSTAGHLQTTLHALCQGGHRQIAIDLQEVGILDTSGIKILMQVHQDLLSSGGGLRLLNVPSHTRRVLHLLNLQDRLVPS